MPVIQEAIDLIKRFEGFSATAYVCPAGKLTIGYGHTGPDVKKGMVITAKKAEELLRKDLEKAEAYVNAWITPRLNPYQYGALVSLVYNVGSLGTTIRGHLNKGQFERAADDFLTYCHIGTVVSEGLRRRRVAESTLFQKGGKR